MAEASNIEEKLPAISEADIKHGFPTSAPMAPGLAVFFNDNLYARCAKLSGIMSRAEGVVPRHLLGKPEACFAVISRAISWNLDVFAVAMATYQTPGGAIGYYGALIQAILENSGKLEGGVKYEHKGDWSKVKGKFKIIDSPKGGKYPTPTWTREDAAGLYVIVSAKVKGEPEPRTLDVYLDSAFPLNSPLWATAPERQLCYLGARAFGNIAMPGIMFGIPFDVDPTGFYGEPMTDITPPRPTKPSEFDRPAKPAAEPQPTATAKPNGGQEPGPSKDAATAETASVEPAQEAPVNVTNDGQGYTSPPAGPLPTRPPTQQVQESKTQPEDREETPLERGQRLLKLCKTVADVGDLRQSVADELVGAELTAWGELCTRRSQAIANPQ